MCARIPEVELLDIDYTLFSKGHNFHFVKCGLGIKDMKKEEEGGEGENAFNFFFLGTLIIDDVIDHCIRLT